MNTMNLKQKIKDHRVEIVISATALIAVTVAVAYKKAPTILHVDDFTGNHIIVAELIGDAKTGAPKHILTEFGAFDLTPHVE